MKMKTNWKSRVIIEWNTLKKGEKIYENSLIDELKKIEKVYIISTGNIFNYLEILLFSKKFNINTNCFYMNYLFRKSEEQEKKWILKKVKEIIDIEFKKDSKNIENKTFIYCDVIHSIIEDLYDHIPIYTDHIWNCKLSGLYEFLTR